MSAELLEHAVLASMLLANEPRPETADALYIHGLTMGMLEGHNILEYGAKLAKQYQCPVAFNGSNGGAYATPDIPGSAWPGANYYIERLKMLGVDDDNLIPAQGLGLHTRHEANQLASLAKEQHWRKVLVLSTGYYAVRAMSCHVAAMYAIDYPFAVYFAQPSEVNWDHPMKGSQGVDDTTAREEARVEIGKIVHNWQKGADGAWRNSYSAPPKMLFVYLASRAEMA
jgi:hypothetical protein